VLFLLATAAFAEAPKQPVPFSHKHHAGTLKLACKMCHPNPDPGERMLIASTTVCMQCHSSIKTDSPHIQRITALDKMKRPVKWEQVYAVPSYVNFNHKLHLAKGNTCQECHGPVAEREEISKETDISMAGCIACHKEKKAGIGCAFCHEQKE